MARLFGTRRVRGVATSGIDRRAGAWTGLGAARRLGSVGVSAPPSVWAAIRVASSECSSGGDPGVTAKGGRAARRCLPTPAVAYLTAHTMPTSA